MSFTVRLSFVMCCLLFLVSFHTEAQTPKVSFNQNVIEGLYSKVALENPDEVFKLVFNNLPDHATIYPTENYYYFSFTANGKMIWGNLRLDAADRDQGILHLGYFEYDENGKFQDYKGYDKNFSAKDGVILNKKSRFVYLLNYAGRTVTFHINDIGMQPPQKVKLRADEKFIGPVFDESGVKFFIVFNTRENHFMYILNNEQQEPEKYRALSDNIVIGIRTGFAYYIDTPQQRKILIGVNADNVKRNNYYDGPFDQLPDNYLKETQMAKYMELAYPEIKGQINEYGHYINNPGNRVMIAPYIVYSDDRELSYTLECRSKFGLSSKFYVCITPDGR